MLETFQTTSKLRLIHYADATRILMGHYGHIAREHFGIALSIPQDENDARYPNKEGSEVDVERATTEGAVFL